LHLKVSCKLSCKASQTRHESNSMSYTKQVVCAQDKVKMVDVFWGNAKTILYLKSNFKSQTDFSHTFWSEAQNAIKWDFSFSQMRLIYNKIGKWHVMWNIWLKMLWFHQHFPLGRNIQLDAMHHSKHLNSTVMQLWYI
jgi:hypothetical protein